MLISKVLVLSLSFAACALLSDPCPEGWHCVRPSEIAQQTASSQPTGCPLGRDPLKTHCLVHGQCPATGYDADMPHVVAAPSRIVTRKLLHVFLHGTDSRPDDYQQWLQASRDSGFYTIGLSYASSPFPDAAVSHFCDCASSSATECLTRYHHSVLFGGNATPWHLQQEDSIESRLLALLVHLKDYFPSDDWKSFIWNGNVAWWASVWSGHSQGGGHVAYLLKVKKLFRAVLLSAPQDAFFKAEPAENVSVSTPWSDVYGFMHSKEDHADIIMQNWRTMAFNGVRDALESTDPAIVRSAAVGALHVSADPLHADSGERLFSARDEPLDTCSCNSRPYHCSTARDSCSFTTSTRLDFWEHLLFAPLLPPPATDVFHSNEGGKLEVFFIALFVVVSLLGLGVGLLQFLSWRRRIAAQDNFSKFDDTQTDNTLRDLGNADDSQGPHVFGNASV